MHTMNCPNCNIELKTSVRRGIHIDFCPTCRGVWLDRGELEQFIDQSSGEDWDRHDPRERDRGEHGFDNDEHELDDHCDGRGRNGRNRRREGFLGEVFVLFG
jgi:Zn-finger nucleic acid-binding protein